MIKSLEEIVFVVEEAPESGYTAKALGASIVTEVALYLKRDKAEVVDELWS